MREIAVERQRRGQTRNVSFQLGFAEDLPLEDRFVDAAVALTLTSQHFARDAEEMERFT